MTEKADDSESFFQQHNKEIAFGTVAGLGVLAAGLALNRLRKHYLPEEEDVVPADDNRPETD